MSAASFILRKGQPRDRMIERICAFLKILGTDKDWQVVVERKKRERSNPQNNALFGVAYKVLREFTGHTLDELHSHFCRSYFGEVEYEVMGKLYKRPRRTTTTDENGKRDVLSTLEFCDFYRFVQLQGAELGAFVPDPDPFYFEHREKAA